MANLIIVVNLNVIVVIYYFALIFTLCRMIVLKKTVEYVCVVIIVLKLKSFSEKQEVNTYNPCKHLNPSSLCFMQEPFPQISTPVTVGCRITIHRKLQLRS